MKNQVSSLVLFWFTSSNVAAWRVSDNVAFGSNREIPCFGTQALLCGPNLISLAQSPKTREILLRAFNYDSIIGMDCWSAAAVKAARHEKKIRVRLRLSLEAELLATGLDSFMLVGREQDRDQANMRITSVNFTANLELGDIFYFTFNNTSLLSADEAANSVWHITLQQTGFHHCWGLVFVVCKTVETTSILQGYVLKQRWYVVLAQTGTEPRNPVVLQESSLKLRIVNGQALEVDEGDSSHVTVTLNQ